MDGKSLDGWARVRSFSSVTVFRAFGSELARARFDYRLTAYIEPGSPLIEFSQHALSEADVHATDWSDHGEFIGEVSGNIFASSCHPSSGLYALNLYYCRASPGVATRHAKVRALRAWREH